MRKEIEMMRVLRVPPLGKLVVEVNEERYENLAEVTHDQLKQRLLAAIGELIVFAGGYKNLVDAGAAPSIQPENVSDAKLEKRQAAFLAHLEAERDIVKSSLRPLPAADAPVLTPEIDKKLSIVEQIDAILQKHIAADAELAQRSVHLAQNPAGGLQIEVDGKYYDRPREITESKIQMVIKQALKEWESS